MRPVGCAAFSILLGLGMPPAFAALEYLPTINVDGVGAIPTETEYVPQVVACEMNTGHLEALKAQAVVARTYAYYQMRVRGSLDSGTADQVFTCDTTLSALHSAAATTTACTILAHCYTTTCDAVSAFYVAGALTTFADGDLVPGLDPTGTEPYVTYNQGRAGAGITQTTLGFTTPNPLDFPYNRGCLSQNGARTLANNGFTYVQILQYYYGADIGFAILDDCGDSPTEADCDAEMLIDLDHDGDIDLVDYHWFQLLVD